MLKFGKVWLIACSVLTAQALFHNTACGQFYQHNSALVNTRLLNSNSSFEAGLSSWDEHQITGEILTRNWTPLDMNSSTAIPFENFGFLGTKLVRLRGQGQWGQIFGIPKSERHVLNLHAYRQGVNGNGAGSFAAARVSYYSSSWNLLDTIEVPIGGRDESKNRGIGDGLNFYSWGIEVPSSASFAHLYIYNSADTEVYADAFGLFDYVQTQSLSVAKNLVVNPNFELSWNTTIDQNTAQGFGNEFWAVDNEWTRGTSSFLRNGVFGSSTHSESAYQVVPLSPKQTYLLRFEGFFPTVTPAEAGVVYFDANWKKIGGQTVVSEPDKYAYMLRIETPANMVHAQVYYWCNTLSAIDVDYSNQLTGYVTLQQLASTVNASTSVILAESLPYLRPKYSDRLGSSYYVVFSDANGVDTTTLSSSNVVFRSRSNSTKTYPASFDSYQIQSSTDGNVVRAKYDIGAGFDDVGEMVLRGKQVKDKLGNYAPSKTFKVDVP